MSDPTQANIASAISPATELIAKYSQRINEGSLPQLISQPGVLEGIEIGEGLLTVIGAPPGAGKTALAMQIMFDALELTPELTAVIANAEMGFDALIRRELVRQTQVSSDCIRFGNLTDDDKDLISVAIGELQPRLENVSVLLEASLVNLQELRNIPPGLVVVDYLQKFAPSDRDGRAGVNDVMAGMRRLAQAGWAVVCLSATKRDGKGKHSSGELDLSSFRESGEIEYNADSAYVLRDEGELEVPYIRRLTLAHVKNRHGATRDRVLRFHMPRMHFSALPSDPQCSSKSRAVVDVDDPFYSGAS